jgi:6-methylsalicylate decarboxylase
MLAHDPASASDGLKIDAHQHMWTEPLLNALAARKSHPLVRRTDGLTVLHSAGEQPYIIEIESERPHRRGSLVRDDGLDLALIAISSPIGIEALPRDEADVLIAAYLEGIASLSGEFAAWGPVALDEPNPRDVDALISSGCVGISLPAGALATPELLETAGPLLERIASRGVPALVHPGPAPRQPRRYASLTEPLWWSALTDYVAQMQAAWLTFAAIGRREHPDLKLVFAMLAGGAPLLSERLTARGGPGLDLRDPLTFYDTSSYGPAAVEAMARRVGPSRLVYGSDRPVVEPVVTGRELLLQQNAAQLITTIRMAA